MRRAPLAALALTAAIALACGGAASILPPDIDLVLGVPKLYQTVRPIPDVPIMNMTEHIKAFHRPREFLMNAILWKYVGRRRHVIAVRVWKRHEKDLPRAGHGKTLAFPNFTPNDPAEDLLPCTPGQYFAQLHFIITSSSGTHQNFTVYFPYNITFPPYQKEPSPKRSWQVTCAKTEQVPNPKGESAPLLVLGKSGWRLTP